MGTNIRVIQPAGNSVSINRQGTQKNIKTAVVPSTITAAQQLSQLADVDSSGASNNEVLIFNEQTNKYEVRDLTVVDGGTF